MSLSIELELESAFIPCLKAYIKEMLKIKGLTSASLLKDVENTEIPVKWVVQYRIKNRMDLDNYFNNHAKQMRQETLDRFCDGFSATRRILNVEL